MALQLLLDVLQSLLCNLNIRGHSGQRSFQTGIKCMSTNGEM
jgi:hypothetical protein